MMRDVFCQRVEDDAFHLKSLTQSAIELCCVIMFVKEVNIEAARAREKMESPKPSHRSMGKAAENIKGPE